MALAGAPGFRRFLCPVVDCFFTLPSVLYKLCRTYPKILTIKCEITLQMYSVLPLFAHYCIRIRLLPFTLQFFMQYRKCRYFCINFILRIWIKIKKKAIDVFLRFLILGRVPVYKLPWNIPVLHGCCMAVETITPWLLKIMVI